MHGQCFDFLLSMWRRLTPSPAFLCGTFDAALLRSTALGVPKSDIAIIYADSVFIVVGFGGHRTRSDTVPALRACVHCSAGERSGRLGDSSAFWQEEAKFEVRYLPNEQSPCTHLCLS